MSEDPDVIRERIEQTRADLSANVDAVGDALDPRQIAHRQADRVRGRVGAVRDRVMGTVHDARDSVGGTVGDAGGSARSVAGDVASGVRDAPHAVARQTEGNPLAAGLIAFGVGLLAASLLPNFSSDSTAPGSMVVTRMVRPTSCRSPSEIARTANLVPE